MRQYRARQWYGSVKYNNIHIIYQSPDGVYCISFHQTKNLHINLVSPNLLLSTSRVRANPQDSLHLRIRHKHNVPRHEPTLSLRARWAGQTTLVSPEVAELVDLIERLVDVHRSVGQSNISLVEVDKSGELVEEGAVRVTRVDTDGEHGTLFALGGVVDEMEFGFGSIALHGVIGRCVDVPAGEVDGLVLVVLVESHGGKSGVDALLVVQSVGWTVSPVVQVSSDFIGVVEHHLMVARQTLVKAERNGTLLSSSLAELPVCRMLEHCHAFIWLEKLTWVLTTPVVGLLICPVTSSYRDAAIATILSSLQLRAGGDNAR